MGKEEFKNYTETLRKEKHADRWRIVLVAVTIIGLILTQMGVAQHEHDRYVRDITLVKYKLGITDK